MKCEFRTEECNGHLCENCVHYRIKNPAVATSGSAVLRIPKKVARITLCGAINFDVLDNMNFIKPTQEQIKNLKETFCIDVELFD